MQAFQLTDVKAYMGHADIQTTMIYVHHVPQHDAADRLGELVEASEDPLEESVSPTVSRTEQISADLTRLDTALEPNRPRPTDTAGTHNPLVGGSNPPRPIERSPATASFS